MLFLERYNIRAYVHILKFRIMQINKEENFNENDISA